MDEDHLSFIEDVVMAAKVSVWIATANVKDMMVRAPIGSAAHARGRYRTVLERFETLAGSGVELRLLHASPPSRAFRASFARQRRLAAGALEMRMCPRSHSKLIVVDGNKAYVGSANFTGAGLGAKGAGRRNFETGFVVEDDVMLDVLQGRFEDVWTGRSCGNCRLRSACTRPLDGDSRMDER